MKDSSDLKMEVFEKKLVFFSCYSFTSCPLSNSNWSRKTSRDPTNALFKLLFPKKWSDYSGLHRLLIFFIGQSTTKNIFLKNLTVSDNFWLAYKMGSKLGKTVLVVKKTLLVLIFYFRGLFINILKWWWFWLIHQSVNDDFDWFITETDLFVRPEFFHIFR